MCRCRQRQRCIAASLIQGTILATVAPRYPAIELPPCAHRLIDLWLGSLWSVFAFHNVANPYLVFHILRRIAMEPLAKEVVKLGLNVLQSVYVSAAKATNLIDFPVPANSSLRKTSSKTIRHYFASGIRSYMPIATMALHQRIDLGGNINILDFGCGVARQLLHFQYIERTVVF